MRKSSLCETLPYQPRVWDATRLRIYQRCKRLHWYQTVRGLRRNRQDATDPLRHIHTDFGKLWHSAVEGFDTLIAAGYPREDATVHTLGSLLEWTWVDGKPWGGEILAVTRCTDPAIRPHKRQPDKLVPNRDRCRWAKQWNLVQPAALARGIGLICMKCGAEIEQQSQYIPYHPKKNRISLIRAFLLYADEMEPLGTLRIDEKVALEHLLLVDLPDTSPDGTPYQLASLIDKIAVVGDQVAVIERKTTSLDVNGDEFWTAFDPEPQPETYALTAGLRYGINGQIDVLVEALQLGANFARIKRRLIPIGPERRTEWLAEAREIIWDAEGRAKAAWYIAKRGHDEEERARLFPRSTANCRGPYGSCPFLSVCSAEPSKHEEILEANFHEERWEPLEEA